MCRCRTRFRGVDCRIICRFRRVGVRGPGRRRRVCLVVGSIVVGLLGGGGGGESLKKERKGKMFLRITMIREYSTWFGSLHHDVPKRPRFS